MQFYYTINWCVLREHFHHPTSYPVQPQTVCLCRLSACLPPWFQRCDAAKLQTVFAIIFFAFGKKNIYLLSNATHIRNKHIRNKHIKGHFIFYNQMQKKMNIFYNILAYNIENTTFEISVVKHH